MNLRLLHYFYLFVFFLFSLSVHTFAQNPSPKYVVHGVLNLEPDLNHGISAMNRMVKAGCNAVGLTIMWDRIYPKADSKPNWAQIDNQINHALNNLHVKIILRIHLGRHIAFTQGFWAAEEAVADFKGKPLTYYYDNNHFSFAYQPAIEKAAGFVKEVCERYKDLQSRGQILFISVVNTPQQEVGYGYENQQFPNPSYFAVFDHSKWSMIKWKDWAKTKYQTIRTLNSYWGTNYKQFSEVEPYVNWGNTKDSFRGLRGKDWYLFRHILLKNYIDRITEAVKSTDATYKVACEFGGVADNLSLLRGTFAFKNLTEKVDIIKTSIDAFQGDGIQGDIIISNLRPEQKFYTEVAHFDQPTPESLRNYVDRAVEYGCEVIMLYVDYDNGKDVEKIMPAVQEGVYWLDKPSPPIVFADSIKYRLSQLIDNREGVVADWRSRSENGKKKIKIIYDEDLVHDKQVIDNPLPDLPDPGPNPDPGPGPGPVVPDPPKPPLQEGPNELPIVTVKDYTYQIVVNQSFIFRIPENLFVDPDGYIAYIEVSNNPNWLHFNKFEFSFYGRSPSLGKTKVNLKIYDNKGASIETSMFIESIPPAIDFELIKADYFDVPIEGWGLIQNNRTLYLENLPEKLNILARCNLDSVKFHFELTGPYKFKNISERLPYNLFGEGRGMKFPVGSYTLKASAYKKDTLITFKTVQFNVKYSTDSTQNILTDWVVYPNPFENICNIKLPLEQDFTTLDFVLYTSAGKRIHIKKEYIKLVNNVAYIDLGIMDIITGSYILEISKAGAVLKRVRVVKI
jgi:hypothetical protein